MIICSEIPSEIAVYDFLEVLPWNLIAQIYDIVFVFQFMACLGYSLASLFMYISTKTKGMMTWLAPMDYVFKTMVTVILVAHLPAKGALLATS
jgi:hypothetical protein